MHEDQRKELLEKWQSWHFIRDDVQNTRGLPKFSQKEFGYICCGQGWVKEVQYQ